MFAPFGAVIIIGGQPTGSGIFSVGANATANTGTGTGTANGASADTATNYGSGVSVSTELANTLATPLTQIAQQSSQFPVAPVTIAIIAGVLGGGALLLYSLSKRSRK